MASPTDLSKEYSAWSNMKQRCLNKKSPVYRYYGGRGIRVCEAWVNSYKTFLADMGMRPSPQHTLDRIDTNGDYEPGNCRWAVKVTQQRNRRDSIHLTHDGHTMPIAEWAVALGISRKTLYSRLHTLGWSPEKALTQDVEAH